MDIKTPTELKNTYGKENIISLVNIQQILTYADFGVQPKMIFRSEFDNKIVAYYLQEDTVEVWKMWRNNK